MTRFDQKNEIFKRARWDEEFRKTFGKGGEKRRLSPGRIGYRPVDQALERAAWSFDETFSSTIYPGIGGMDAKPGAKPLSLSPEAASRVLKDAARFLGADLAGVCELDDSFVYSHSYSGRTGEHQRLEVPPELRTALVMAVSMDRSFLDSSPDLVAGAATGLGYSKMAFLGFLVARFIRELGYRAVSSGNDTALSIPLAIKAGLGEQGRNGLLVTEEYGASVRIVKVFTDLPALPDRPISFGLEAFCGVCRRCVKSCPAGAISAGEKERKGPSALSSLSGPARWVIDPEKCFGFWKRSGGDCSNCIRSCPVGSPKGLKRALLSALFRFRGGSPFVHKVLLKFLQRVDPPRRKKPDIFG